MNEEPAYKYDRRLVSIIAVAAVVWAASWVARLAYTVTAETAECCPEHGQCYCAPTEEIP